MSSTVGKIYNMYYFPTYRFWRKDNQVDTQNENLKIKNFKDHTSPHRGCDENKLEEKENDCNAKKY